SSSSSEGLVPMAVAVAPDVAGMVLLSLQEAPAQAWLTKERWVRCLASPPCTSSISARESRQNRQLRRDRDRIAQRAADALRDRRGSLRVVGHQAARRHHLGVGGLPHPD